jgi:hypothetical protein
VLYEWNPRITTPHTDSSVHANCWFGLLIGDDARKNNRSFPTKAAENAALWYNHTVGPMAAFVGGEFREGYFTVPIPPSTVDPASSKSSSTPVAAIAVGTFIAGLLVGAGALFAAQSLQKRRAGAEQPPTWKEAGGRSASTGDNL